MREAILGAMGQTAQIAQIRRIGGDEVTSLEPLWRAFHEHHLQFAARLAAVVPPRRPQDSWAVRRRHYESLLGDPRRGFCLVGFSGRRPIGYATVGIEEGSQGLWATGDRVAELRTLSVAPDARGLGLGSALLREACRELDRDEIRAMRIRVLTYNADAIRFYTREGAIPFQQHMLLPVSPMTAPFAVDACRRKEKDS